MSLAIACDATPTPLPRVPLACVSAPNTPVESPPHARSPTRRSGADVVLQLGLIGQPPSGDPFGDNAPQLVGVEDPLCGHGRNLVPVGLDIAADNIEFGGTGGDRGHRLVPGVSQTVGDQVGEELLVTLFVGSDPVDQTVELGFVDP